MLRRFGLIVIDCLGADSFAMGILIDNHLNGIGRDIAHFSHHMDRSFGMLMMLMAYTTGCQPTEKFLRSGRTDDLTMRLACSGLQERKQSDRGEEESRLHGCNQSYD